MKIEKIIVKKKGYKFFNPILTSQEKINRRDVISVKIFGDSGNCGVGGAYPLPPFTEKASAVFFKAEELSESLKGKDFSSLEDFASNSAIKNITFPTLRFAFETAYINLLIDSEKINEVPFINKVKSAPIKMNALISASETSSFFSSIEEAIKNGFDTLKIKLGFSSFENELIRLGFLRTLSNNVKLRLDINGAWQFEEAAKKIERLLQFDLEYVEDPTESFEENMRLAKLFPGSIAFDQTVNSTEEVDLISEIGGVLILKPAFFGSITKAVETIDLYKQRNSKLIISSAFEDACGRETNYALASLLAAETVHGINTQNIFDEDSEEMYEVIGNRILFSKEKYLRKEKCSEAE